MANRFFQGYIYQLQNTIHGIFGVIDNKEIISCSNQELIGNKNTFSLMKVDNRGQAAFVQGDYTYRIFYESSFMRLAVFAEGKNTAAKDYVDILSVCFAGMKSYFEENYNRHLFYKNLFLGNILPEDINVRAKMLKIPPLTSRIVYLLRFKQVQSDWDLSMINTLAEYSEDDEIFDMTETDVIVISKMRAGAEQKTVLEKGRKLQEDALKLYKEEPIVGVGSIVVDIRQLTDSYKEAVYALELLYLFDADRTILDYNHLGIRRLIYQLPLPICEIYLQDVFIKGSFESLDQATLEVVKCFFDNNLNVSETARQLFIHRNTLMYRLEKVRKLTGLDLKQFDHAIVFRLAMIVNDHVKHLR